MSAWEITTICLLSVIAFGMLTFALCMIGIATGVIKLLHAVKHKLDPLLHTVDRVGRCVDDETEYLDEADRKYGPAQTHDWVSTLVEVTKWASVGAALFSKFRKRR